MINHLHSSLQQQEVTRVSHDEFEYLQLHLRTGYDHAQAYLALIQFINSYNNHKVLFSPACKYTNLSHKNVQLRPVQVHNPLVAITAYTRQKQTR